MYNYGVCYKCVAEGGPLFAGRRVQNYVDRNLGHYGHVIAPDIYVVD